MTSISVPQRHAVCKPVLAQEKNTIVQYRCIETINEHDFDSRNLVEFMVWSVDAVHNGIGELISDHLRLIEETCASPEILTLIRESHS